MSSMVLWRKPVLQQHDIDIIKSGFGFMSSAAKEGYTNTRHKAGDEVIVWVNDKGEPLRMEGIVVDVHVGTSDNDMVHVALYNVAVKMQAEGLYAVIFDIAGNISAITSKNPEHSIMEWPVEVLIDRRPKQRPKLSVVKG